MNEEFLKNIKEKYDMWCQLKQLEKTLKIKTDNNEELTMINFLKSCRMFLLKKD